MHLSHDPEMHQPQDLTSKYVKQQDADKEPVMMDFTRNRTITTVIKDKKWCIVQQDESTIDHLASSKQKEYVYVQHYKYNSKKKTNQTKWGTLIMQRMMMDLLTQQGLHWQHRSNSALSWIMSPLFCMELI